MQAKLSATTIKPLQPSDKPYEVLDTQLKGFLLRVQPSGRMTFYYTYRAISGKRKRIKVGAYGSQCTPQQARDLALEFAGMVAKGLDVQIGKQEERKKALAASQRTLGAFIKSQYQPWVLANRKTGKETLERVEACFAEFMPLELSEINVSRMEAWRTTALKNGRKPSTINRSVVALRGIITKAVEWDFLEKHPLEKLKPLSIDKAPKVRFLSEAEELRLLAALTARDEAQKDARIRGNQHRAKRGYPLLPELKHHQFGDRLTPMVLLSLKTGLRQGELFDLSWDNVDLRKRVVTIEGATAKSGNTRHIPLSDTAHRALERWALQSGDRTGRVFPSDTGGRLDNVRKAWATLLKAAKIEAFRWHDMRHDFASKLVMRGVPLNTVRELCGHADYNTTLRYAHLAEDHKADAIAMLG